MTNQRTICVVTGNRADYSYLYYPMRLIEQSDDLSLQLIVTGQHLAQDYGNTVQMIEQDGFNITAKIEMLESQNDACSITKSMGNELIKLADFFDTKRPDMLLVLGDRFEIMAAVQAALIARIPVAHIGGGDISEGAFDDAMRHAITKMSHVHFATNQTSYHNLIQMGENPKNVHLVGSPSLDVINEVNYISKENWLKEVGLNDGCKKHILVTYHPETLSSRSPQQDAKIILSTLSQLKDTGIVLTGANSDTGGKMINKLFSNYAKDHNNVVFHLSLGKELFFNTLKYVDVFLGNSSSGLYEAPTFKLPFINIADRQKGRLKPNNVIDCVMEESSILSALEQAYALDRTTITSPYGEGGTSEKIVAILSAIDDPQTLLQKTFYKIG